MTTPAATSVLAVVLAVIGAERWDPVGLRGAVRDQEADALVFEAQRVRVLREGEASGRVAARVIAGELSLVAAVDELEPTLRARPGFEYSWEDESPPTFRHRVGRYVVTRVATELERDPTRCAAILARLDVEYAALR